VIGPTGQGLGDGIEDVLVACPENDVRAHAGRSLGDPADGERGVPLAAAERLAAGSGQVRRPSYPGLSSEPEMEQLRGCLTPGQGRTSRARVPARGWPWLFSRPGTRRWFKVRESP